MKLQQLVLTSRSITMEFENRDIFKMKNTYSVTLNGEKVITNINKNVFSIFNLVPNTNYELQILFDNGLAITEAFITKDEWVRLNVKKFGAAGDGITDDTKFIQAAILACPDNSTVFFPKGIYYTSPLFLKSNINIEFEEGATLLGHIDRNEYPILPGYTIANNERDEYLLGTWEGNPLDMFASLITGINVENVNIVGKGILDGNAQNSDWWQYPKVKNKAYRPRMVFLKNCRNIVFQGQTIMNSPCWTVHPYLSRNLKFIDLKVENIKDSPNTDGIDPESCSDVDIIGVEFSVGDDCIAIKSGKLYMGMKYQIPSQNFNIRNCLMQFGHGAVVLGSEMSGGIRNIEVKQCIFKETDRGLRIKTRRGRGKYAVIENVKFRNIYMEKVLTPFVINMFYFCDPDGKSEYVWSRDKLKVDEWTPYLGEFKFKDILCVDSEVAGGHFSGLPEQPIEKIEFENVSIHFSQNSSYGKPAMMSNIEPVSRLGFYFENVNKVVLNNTELMNYEGSKIIKQNVKKIIES